MELTGLVAALLRRWYVVVLGLLVTVGLGFAAFAAAPPTYSAAGSVLLLPPSGAVTTGSNQLLQLGGLEQPASLVVAYVAGDDVREKFAEEYPDATYDVVLDPLSRGPLIMMTVEAPTSDMVMDALDGALAAVPDALVSLQDQVAAPPESRFLSMPLAVDNEPTTVTKATLRALIAAVGAGLALTLVGAVGLDSLALRRQRRSGTGRRTASPGEAPRPGPASVTGGPAGSSPFGPVSGPGVGAVSGPAGDPTGTPTSVTAGPLREDARPVPDRGHPEQTPRRRDGAPYAGRRG